MAQMIPSVLFPYDLDVPSELAQKAALQWLEVHSEPTLESPPDRDAVRRELMHLNEHARIAYSQEHPHPEGRTFQENFLHTTRTFHHYTAWRLFPVNSFPDDILFHIFRLGMCHGTQTVEYKDKKDKKAKKDKKRLIIPPVIYSQVCRHWRHLALDAPWLWTNIDFKDRGPEYPLTTIFIERAKNAPLNIVLKFIDQKFDFDDDSNWSGTEALMDRLGLLAPHVHRWKSFRCETDNWDPLFGVLGELSNLNMPSLRSLDFTQRFENYVTREERTQVPVFRGGTPALESLSLTYAILDWDNLITACSNLTQLVLTNLSVDDYGLFTVHQFHTFLRTATNLKSLKLNGAGPKRDDEALSTLSPVLLPSLEEFVVEGRRMGTTDTDLDYISFILRFLVPSRTIRCLGIGLLPQESNFSRFIPMLELYMSQIERLAISEMPMTTQEIGEWLRVLRNLNHISICGQRFQDKLFETLVTDPATLDITIPEGIFCPSLVSISPYCVDEDSSSLTAVVTWRLHKGFPLRSIVLDLYFSKVIKAEDYQTLIQQTGIVFEYEEKPSRDSADEWLGPFGENGDDYDDNLTEGNDDMLEPWDDVMETDDDDFGFEDD
ncbi:hypothetical protein M422DRAFT_29267 [Sphaerobolus stellatus SS14]|nr:hypothetical protein M422DRAFT_29267 [Sphaerobolus stellatus SS14]